MNALEKYAAKQKLIDRLREKGSPATGAALGAALGYRLGLLGMAGGAALGAHMGKKKGVQYQGSPSARAAIGATAASTLAGIPYVALAMRDVLKSPDLLHLRSPKGALRKALYTLPLAAAAAGAGLAARSAKPKLNKTAQLSAIGKAIGGMKVPKMTLGGLPLSRAYPRAMGAVARNPGRTALGLTGAGGLAFMAGRASK